MGTHPIFESDFDCLTVKMSDSEYECTPTKRARLEVAQLSPRIRKPRSTHGLSLVKIDNSVKKSRDSFVVLPNDDLSERIRKLENLYDDAFRSEAEVFFFRICKNRYAK